MVLQVYQDQMEYQDLRVHQELRDSLDLQGRQGLKEFPEVLGLLDQLDPQDQ
jgi:hypothetical protein